MLLQVVFHTRMEEEAGGFDFDDVVTGICKKLIHRHPHIFSDVEADTADKVLRNWDAIKKEEKHQTSYTETLEQVPKRTSGFDAQRKGSASCQTRRL